MVGEFLKMFKALPPRQKAASFTIDQASENEPTAPRFNFACRPIEYTDSRTRQDESADR